MHLISRGRLLNGILIFSRRASLVPRPSSAREERGRVWNITPGGSVPKECCAQVIMTRNLAFVVSRAYKECKLRSILLKCARARAVHAARLGTFSRPFEYSGLTPCIVANQHLSRNFCLRDTSAQGYVPDPPSLFSRTGGSGDETIVVLCAGTMTVRNVCWEASRLKMTCYGLV